MARGRPSRQSIYDLLEADIDDLRKRMGGLPAPTEAEEIWDDLWHQEAHHSTALEGNTLILNEVRKLLDEGQAVGDKELKEYMEVLGYGKRREVGLRPGTRPGRLDDRGSTQHPGSPHRPLRVDDAGLGCGAASARDDGRSARELAEARHCAVPGRDDSTALA